MDSSPDDDRPADLGLPDASDNTLEKIACIEEMLNRMQHVTRAPDVFSNEMLGMVNKEDVSKMVEVQNHMLSRFEKTNEMLLNFNTLSIVRYETTCHEYKRHTLLLTQMKKDLDNVFRRIRVIKTKLNTQYPEAFNATKMPRQLTEEEEEDETNKPSRVQDIGNNSQTQQQESQSGVSESASSQSFTLPKSNSVESSEKCFDRPRNNESPMNNIAEVIDGED